MLPSLVDALEAGDDRDLRRASSAARSALVVDAADARRPKALSVVDADLMAEERARRHADVAAARCAEQRRRHLLAGRDQRRRISRSVGRRAPRPRRGRAGDSSRRPSPTRPRRLVPGLPACAATRRATCRMRSTSPTEVPPYFCTIEAMRSRSCAGATRGGEPAPRGARPCASSRIEPAVARRARTRSRITQARRLRRPGGADRTTRRPPLPSP